MADRKDSIGGGGRKRGGTLSQITGRENRSMTITEMESLKTDLNRLENRAKCDEELEAWRDLAHDNGELKLHVKVLYGLADIITGASDNLIGFYFNFFLLEVASLKPQYAAYVLLISIFGDSINDPVAGMLTDRTHSRYGRRRPWLFVVPLFWYGAWIANWLVPASASQGELFAYYICIYLTRDTLYTFIAVPYSALTPEISPDYQQRAVLNGYRFVISFLGGAIIIPIHSVLINSLGGTVQKDREAYIVSSFLWGFVQAVPVVLFFFFAREPLYIRDRVLNKEKRKRLKAEKETHDGILAKILKVLNMLKNFVIQFFVEIKQAFSVKLFAILATFYMVGVMTLEFVQSNIVLAIKYNACPDPYQFIKDCPELLDAVNNCTEVETVSNATDVTVCEQYFDLKKKCEPVEIAAQTCPKVEDACTLSCDDMETVTISIITIMIVVGLVLDTLLIKKFGKKRAYHMSLITVIVLFFIFYFTYNLHWTVLLVLGALAGPGIASTFFIPFTMLPDVIDVDELKTGERREGLFFGVFVFFKKLGLAVCVTISNSVLADSGYINPTTENPYPRQPYEVKQALRAMVGIVPVGLLILSFIISIFYNLPEDKHLEIRKELKKRLEEGDGLTNGGKEEMQEMN